MKKEENKINFIFGLLNKKIVISCILLGALDDFIYYIVPFTFTFLLTLPFTIKKAVIVVSIFIISKLLKCGLVYYTRKISSNYLYKYSKIQYLEFYKKVTALPIETLSKYQTGYLENIIEKTTYLVREILKTEYISIILSFVFFFYTAYNQSITLFIITFILSSLCLILSIHILIRANNQVDKLYDKEYEYSSKYQDYINNIRTIKSLNNSKYFEKNIKKESKDCYKENTKYVSLYTLEELIRNILITIPFILVIIKAIIDLSNGIDTIGIIVFYISLEVEMGFIFEELSNNILNWFELKTVKKGLKKLFKTEDNRIIINDFNEIKLKNIDIKYKDTKFHIKLNNMVINKNDKISITGKSGEGKTTILNLILGNLNCYKGNLVIDNLDTKNIKLDIGVISQEIELFNMTIKENLCLGKKISDITLIKYLKELELDDFLEFENGLNTKVGEKGLKLSTGQKRRINILRSYLMNKNIYILDEPTSNLDKHTEDIVVKFILKYFKDKTLIIATHNPKINKICNKFYVVENHKLKQIKKE